MGSKKPTKKAVNAAHVKESSFIVASNKTVEKWTDRQTTTLSKITQVQRLLGSLAAGVEGCNKELEGIYEDANLLSTLRIVEYHQKRNPSATVSVTRKQKSGRDSLSRSSRVSVIENSTEALIAAMDEKKQQKVIVTLVNLFKRGNRETITPNSAGVFASQLQPSYSAFNNESIPVVSASLSAQLSDTASLPRSADPRRPRDIPVEIWDELLRLRFRRIVLEDRVTVLTDEIKKQLERLDLLTQSHDIATYMKDAIYHKMQMY